MNSSAIYATAQAVPNTVEHLQQQLAELRAAARDYFAQSDLVTLTREAVVAADRLEQLLSGTDAV